mmetsp:Transcript_41524/g.133528  ORF Transcript_41524/g.133528 Transcript_41524/m.133528 type:complete len:242 (+) Transcript_41524:928-1653(+)
MAKHSLIHPAAFRDELLQHGQGPNRASHAELPPQQGLESGAEGGHRRDHVLVVGAGAVRQLEHEQRGGAAAAEGVEEEDVRHKPHPDAVQKDGGQQPRLRLAFSRLGDPVPHPALGRLDPPAREAKQPKHGLRRAAHRGQGGLHRERLVEDGDGSRAKGDRRRGGWRCGAGGRGREALPQRAGFCNLEEEGVLLGRGPLDAEGVLHRCVVVPPADLRGRLSRPALALPLVEVDLHRGGADS